MFLVNQSDMAYLSLIHTPFPYRALFYNILLIISAAWVINSYQHRICEANDSQFFIVQK